MTTTGASPSSPLAIELAGLAKTYGRGRTARVAVRPTTLSVPWGQVIGLLGPNGAGKTTIIKMICGLVTPTAGTVALGGWDVARHRSQAVLLVGAVLEGSRNVYWPLSAWENLLYFGRLKGLRTAEVRPRAEQLLRDLDLWQRRHEPVGSYSRGMQQKVAVSAALIADPPILLLDEPTLGLDVEAARTFKDWIAHLARDEGKTIVLTTHQLPVAQELAGRIAVIRTGEIIADLPTAELLARHGEDRYELRLASSDDGLTDALPTGAQTRVDGGQVRVRLPADDPGGLYGVLDRLRTTNATLLAVEKAQPTLEEVLLRLLHDDTTTGGSAAADQAGRPT